MTGIAPPLARAPQFSAATNTLIHRYGNSAKL
jgi:hypothetical protein